MEENKSKTPTTVGNWLVTLLITFIPIIGIIMLFVWAFGSGTKTSKSNWAKASLLLLLIAISLAALSVIFDPTRR